MNLGIVISSNDPETVWNAFRLGNLALSKEDDVRVFLLAKGVEADKMTHQEFDVPGQMDQFIQNSGHILACQTCLEVRNTEAESCEVSTMGDLYQLILDSDKVFSV